MSRAAGRHITFCLCPGLPLFGVASALDVLRHANRLHGLTFYSWAFLSEGDVPVDSSSGLRIIPSCSLREARDADIALIVAGFHPTELDMPLMLEWLRKQALDGRTIGGISNGAFLLARGKLLNGYAATVHWEDFPAFCALYPRVMPRYQRYIIDRTRMTCAGGAASLDLFLEIVRQDFGNELALQVARQMLLQDVPGPDTRLPNGMQLGSAQFSFRVQRALSVCEHGADQGLGVNQLAGQVGLSRRQLLRLFRRETGKTPMQLLLERRLERARSLVLNSQLPLAMVAIAVGFSSQSHLTSAYRRFFGQTPAKHRRSQQTRF